MLQIGRGGTRVILGTALLMLAWLGVRCAPLEQPDCLSSRECGAGEVCRAGVCRRGESGDGDDSAAADVAEDGGQRLDVTGDAAGEIGGDARGENDADAVGDAAPFPDATGVADTTLSSDTDGVCGPLPFDPSGDWYMSLSVTLDRERPFYLRTTFVPEDDGTWTATLQPLMSDDTVDPDTGERSPRTDRRTPTGDPIVVSGVDLDGDAFTIEVNGLVLDDDANAITGRLVRADLAVTGSFRDHATACGSVAGAIVEPLSLSLVGSTFTLFRADDFSVVTDVPIHCDQLPAPQPPPLEGCETDPSIDTCEAFDPAGTWLLALSTTLDRERPLLLELEVTAAGGAYDFLFQPLATDEAIDADTGGRAPRDNPRVPVGDAIETTGVSVNLTSGAFAVIATGLTFVDDANPITGRAIRGDVTLMGSFLANDWACGDVTGSIVEPITVPLAGSTFAIIRSDDPVSVRPIRYNCAQLPRPLECAVPRNQQSSR